MTEQTKRREGEGYKKFHILRILVYLLQNSSPEKRLTAAQIAQKLGIRDAKTVRANINTLCTEPQIFRFLSVLGIKRIHVCEKDYFGKFVEKDLFDEGDDDERMGRSGKKNLYYYAEPMLSKGDTTLIKASLYANQYLKPQTFSRIRNVLDHHMEQLPDYGFGLPGDGMPEKRDHLVDNLIRLEECIKRRHLCSFSYGSYRRKENSPRMELADAGKGSRSFVCHAILSANGYYYLLASPVKDGHLPYLSDDCGETQEEVQADICRDNDAYRTYRVDRILSPADTGRHLPGWLRAPKSLERYLHDNGRLFLSDEYRQEHPIMFGSQNEQEPVVRIRCDSILLNNMWDIFYTKCRIEEEDKEKRQVVIRLDRCSKMGIINVCVEYCQHMELLEPKEYRDEIREILRQAASRYGNR